MKKKIQKKFIDNGCGFPVILKDVPMVFVRGEWTPDINYNELMRVVVHALADKSVRLTGNEIKFITNYFEFTYEAFGKYFDVSKQDAMKCMKTGDGKMIGDDEFRKRLGELIGEDIPENLKVKWELASDDTEIISLDYEEQIIDIVREQVRNVKHGSYE